MGLFTDAYNKSKGITTNPNSGDSSGIFKQAYAKQNPSSSQQQPDKGVKGFGTGLVKGALRLGLGATRLIGKGTGDLLNKGSQAAGLGKIFNSSDIYDPSTAAGQKAVQAVTPQGAAEKAGATTFDIGSIFAQPELAIDKLGISGLTHLAESGAISPETLNMLKDTITSKFGTAALRAVQNAVQGGGYAALQTAGQGGSASDIKRSAIVGGLFNTVAEPIASSIGGKILGKTLSPDEISSKALEDVTPTLSKNEKIAAASTGKAKPKGIFGTITPVADQQTKDAAKAVENVIKGKSTFNEKIGAVRDAIVKEAENLKAKIKSVDHPYTFKELSSKMNSVETPISVKGTAFEKQIGSVKKAALAIAKKNGGTISSLLDARKEFDALIQKEYPNLYDAASAPMKNAITAIRNTMNDFIEEELPDDVSFKDSLKLQSNMYNAIDGMGAKAADEFGSNVITRTAAKYPTVARVAWYGGAGVAGGAAATVANKLGL